MEIRWLEDQCNQCLLCVKDCISGTIQKTGKIPGALEPDWCNRCSHCLAVCPRDAIVHKALDPKDVRPVDQDRIDPDAYREAVLTRRSVRHYKKKPVGRALLEDILDTARHSPTASNTQNVEYILVRDKDLLQRTSRRVFSFGEGIYRLTQTTGGRAVTGAARKLGPGKSMDRYIRSMDYYKKQTHEKGRDFILHNAPVLLLILAPSRAAFSCDNCNIAATNITNYAHCLGLGTCYTGMLTMALKFDPGLRKMLGIPKGKKAFATLVMGWPAYHHANTASRKQPGVRWL